MRLITQTDITTLYHGLGAVFRHTGLEAARRMSAGWPAAATAGCHPVANDLPVTDWLPQAVANAPEATVGLVRALADVSDGLRWQQTYSKDDLGQHFLDRYGWVMLLGPDAPVKSNSLLAGFLLLGPGIEYPVHKHAAEEIYVVLSGRASWKTGHADWHLRTAGAILHNPPWQPHGMRTDHREPLLAGFMWNAGTLEKSQMVPPDPAVTHPV